ncbi:MAG: undecaprenyl/decaprenyl-phosphate alpha-N-acetylglucosaminyl 1-phosphate transferase [bacterium]|nr:undecaprenyl/decaprenyl-phosphate alpha-N-acetylglucosaminyl 1-phosphate transferase [bacterium]
MDIFSFYIPILITAFTVTIIITPLVKKLSIRAGLVDKPSERKIHQTPVPRMGGLAIFTGFIITVSVCLPFNKQLAGILSGGLIVLLVGILDDIFSLKPWIKLSGQITAALVVYHFGISISFISNPFGGMLFLSWLALPVTIIWIIGMMNIINLIDGLDGLAAGISAISAGALFIVALSTGQFVAATISIAILGSCLGFLRFNFWPAQIFMGDSGAMFLGYILATTSITGVLKSTITLSIAVPLIVLGIPVSDTLFAIFRRIKNKQALFKPDTEHVHHKLLDSGFSQKQVVFCSYIGSIILGLIAIFITKLSGFTAYIIFGICLFIFYQTFLIFRKNLFSILSKLNIFI